MYIRALHVVEYILIFIIIFNRAGVQFEISAQFARGCGLYLYPLPRADARAKGLSNRVFDVAKMLQLS